jgi:hypothetical protein
VVFSRASRPAFTITTNGEAGILQIVPEIFGFLCLDGGVALLACLQALSRFYLPATFACA